MLCPYSHYTYPHHIHLCSYAEYDTLIQMGVTCTQSCWIQVRQSFNFVILRCITYFRVAICVQILPSPAYAHLICLSLGLKGFPMNWGVHFSTLFSYHTNLGAHRNSGTIKEYRNHTICLIYSYLKKVRHAFHDFRISVQLDPWTHPRVVCGKGCQPPSSYFSIFLSS